MTLMTLAYIAADLIAVALLVGALYAPRHSRKDLAAAYIGVNVGVLAVTLLLSTANVAAGLGLGLFGVLSIIRLRSTALSQHEVAYFFAALALGLLGGIQTASLIMVVALMALVVASLWVADHPALMRRSRHQVVVLDRALTDETAIVAYLEQLLGATVRSIEVERVDLVTDTTQVDVRFLVPRGTGRDSQASPAAQPGQSAAPSAHVRADAPVYAAGAAGAAPAPSSAPGTVPASGTAPGPATGPTTSTLTAPGAPATDRPASYTGPATSTARGYTRGYTTVAG